MKSIILFLTVPAFFILSNCQKKIQQANSAPNNTSQSHEKINMTTVEDNEIFMNIVPNTFEHSSMGEAKLKVVNNLKERVTTEDFFTLQYNNDGTWEKVRAFDRVVFNDMAYIVGPGSYKEFPINLTPNQYKYKPGNYRISKKVLVEKKEKVLIADFVVR